MKFTKKDIAKILGILTLAAVPGGFIILGILCLEKISKKAKQYDQNNTTTN
jgi:hypothetical protein